MSQVPQFPARVTLPSARQPKKHQKRMRLSAINVDLVEYQLMNILAKDVRHLLEKVRLQILSKDQAQSLVNYLKLTKDLKKQKLQELENMSEEELKKLIAGQAK